MKHLERRARGRHDMTFYCDICGKELRPSDPRRVVERHRGMLPVHEECAKQASTAAMLALIPESLGGNLKR